MTTFRIITDIHHRLEVDYIPFSLAMSQICYICKVEVDPEPNQAICQNCESAFCENHLTPWLSKKNICPVCGLDFVDMSPPAPVEPEPPKPQPVLNTLAIFFNPELRQSLLALIVLLVQLLVTGLLITSGWGVGTILLVTILVVTMSATGFVLWIRYRDLGLKYQGFGDQFTVELPTFNRMTAYILLLLLNIYIAGRAIMQLSILIAGLVTGGGSWAILFLLASLVAIGLLLRYFREQLLGMEEAFVRQMASQT